MSEPLLPVQTAIVTALKANATLMGLVEGVFDHVPPEQAFPYVVVGDATSVPDDDHSLEGEDVACTILICSRYSGFKEALQIAAQVDVTLDGQALTVTGFSSLKCERDFRQTRRDNDGVTRYVDSRYRIGVYE